MGAGPSDGASHGDRTGRTIPSQSASRPPLGGRGSGSQSWAAKGPPCHPSLSGGDSLPVGLPPPGYRLRLHALLQAVRTLLSEGPSSRWLWLRRG